MPAARGTREWRTVQGARAWGEVLGGPATAHGATSDELCGTVLSTSAGDTGTAVAVGVATGGHTALTVARTAIVAATAGRQALRIIVTITAGLAEEPAVARAFHVTRTAIVTRTAHARAGLCVAAGNKQRHGWSRKRNGRGGAGGDRPAAVAARTDQPPPVACATGIVHDRDACVRRQWQRLNEHVGVLSLGKTHGFRIGWRLLAVREPPTAGGGEQNEVDEQTQGMPRPAATCAMWMFDPASMSAANLSHR